MSDFQMRALLDRLERAMLKMSGAQRELVERHVLEHDPELAPALPGLVGMIRSTKRIHLPFRRDGVS